MDFNVEGFRRYLYIMSDLDFSKFVRNEFWIYFNVLEKVIVFVFYLKVFFLDGLMLIGFLLWKFKVVFVFSYIIFCLEFCVVVLVIEVIQIVVENMDMFFVLVKYFIDSCVVFGYIYNDKE